MRIECACGFRHPVREAQAGTAIRCRCGETLQAPSLRELRSYSSERKIAEVFNDAEFWLEQGCFLCGRPMTSTEYVTLELRPALWGKVPRKAQPGLFVLAKLFLGPLGLFATAVGVAASGPERVLIKEAYIMRLGFGVCRDCQESQADSGDSLGAACLSKLRSDRLGRELFEDYPGMRRVKSQ